MVSMSRTPFGISWMVRLEQDIAATGSDQAVAATPRALPCVGVQSQCQLAKTERSVLASLAAEIL